jgi:hypothetical protein
MIRELTRLPNLDFTAAHSFMHAKSAFLGNAPWRGGLVVVLRALYSYEFVHQI